MSVAALVAVMAGGCEEREPPCPSPVVSLRDPESLGCTSRKVPTAACPEIGPLPPWPLCDGTCEDIRDAATCAGTVGCRIGWLDCLTFPDQCDHEQGLIGCYGVVTTTPAEGACADVQGAAACASRDDCAGVYINGTTCPGGDPFPAARQPDGEACRFSYAHCTDELSPPS